MRGYLHPPPNPDDCIFAKTTACLSADLKQPITPCQYGGDPDCTQCGCMASVGLQALGDYRLGGVIPLKSIFTGSLAIGAGVRKTARDHGAYHWLARLYCPLCGEPNDCGAAAGKGVCWCWSADVPEELISRVPEEVRGTICVCEKCTQAQLEGRAREQSSSMPPQERD